MSYVLNALIHPEAEGPALRLLARTAAALRGDADYVATPGDVVGGAFLESQAPVALRADSLEAVRGRIEALEAVDARSRLAAQAAGAALNEVLALPDPVREAALEAMGHTSWRFAGFGLKRLPLGLEGPGEAELLRIEPGSGAPSHDHEGEELTLVLTGAFHDGHAWYGPGDIAAARPGLVHRPVAEPGAVCFALAVSYGGPRFNGPLGLIQRALRLH